MTSIKGIEAINNTSAVRSAAEVNDWQVVSGDCIDVLKGLTDSCIDSVVTDPPYELGFMGKKWDSSGIVYSVELWREVLRVLKPGGHLLAFGGTRTYHRMTCAIEDAGFEIRDSIHWLYGVGFPKSLSIEKEYERLDYICNCQRTGEPGTVRDQRRAQACGRCGKALRENVKGLGTALKPTHEPIVLARKPLISTVAANVQEYGTGALNIDASRIAPSTRDDYGRSATNAKGTINAHEGFEGKSFVILCEHYEMDAEDILTGIRKGRIQ